MSTRAYSLVTVQDGLEFVSPVALSQEDAESLLEVDALLHRAAGWRVVEAERVVLARRGKVARLVRARPLGLDVGRGNENRAVV